MIFNIVVVRKNYLCSLTLDILIQLPVQVKNKILFLTYETRKKNLRSGFKIKAVQLSNERDNISELARELGIKVTLLYKWRKEYEEFGEGSFPGKGNLKLTPEQEKIHELEKKLKDAELERDILKKVIGIFYS